MSLIVSSDDERLDIHDTTISINDVDIRELYRDSLKAAPTVAGKGGENVHLP